MSGGARMMAVVLWTKLVDAMRQDGIIDPAITQSGPATTAVLIDAAQDGQWFNMRIKPQPGKEVVAMDDRGKIAAPLEWDQQHGWLWNGSHVNEARFVKWRFVR